MSKLQPFGQGRANSKRKIQHILDNKGKNFVDVAQMAGVSKQTVSATVNGFRHSPKVLEALRVIGIHEQFLFDPRKSTNVCREGHENLGNIGVS